MNGGASACAREAQAHGRRGNPSTRAPVGGARAESRVTGKVPGMGAGEAPAHRCCEGVSAWAPGRHQGMAGAWASGGMSAWPTGRRQGMSAEEGGGRQHKGAQEAPAHRHQGGASKWVVHGSRGGARAWAPGGPSAWQPKGGGVRTWRRPERISARDAPAYVRRGGGGAGAWSHDRRQGMVPGRPQRMGAVAGVSACTPRTCQGMGPERGWGMGPGRCKRIGAKEVSAHRLPGGVGAQAPRRRGRMGLGKGQDLGPERRWGMGAGGARA